MTIQYDGTNLHGWQIQKNARTVQGEIQNSMQKIFSDQRINLIGSGRTDSGVHALEQIANISFVFMTAIENSYSPEVIDVYFQKIKNIPRV